MIIVLDRSPDKQESVVVVLQGGGRSEEKVSKSRNPVPKE